MIAECHQAIIAVEVLKGHICLPIGTERERLQGRRAPLVDRRIGVLRRVKLVNNIDGLRGHAEL